MEDQEFSVSDSTEESGKGLRAQLEQALKEKKQLEGEMQSLRGKVRQTEVTQFLSTKGVNAKIAKFIPSDIEGEEAIDGWLQENADVFGFTVNSDPQADATESAAPTVADDVIESAKRIQNLGQNSVSPSQLADIQGRIANASTEAELDALLAEAQKFVL